MKYTKYEKARLIGSRALQISQGAKLLIKLDKKKLEEIRYSPLAIAEKEFDEGKIPMTVSQPLPKKRVSDEK